MEECDLLEIAELIDAKRIEWLTKLVEAKDIHRAEDAYHVKLNRIELLAKQVRLLRRDMRRRNVRELNFDSITPQG
jgi:hypothetical protein